MLCARMLRKTSISSSSVSPSPTIRPDLVTMSGARDLTWRSSARLARAPVRLPHGEARDDGVDEKRVAAIVKIQIPAGNATPAPPVGTALGPHGVNIMDFCKMYNAQTESQRGTIVPVEITVFEDRSFTFVTKTPPTPVLLRAAARLDKASQTPGREVVATITEAQVTEIARTKLPDLNTDDIEAAKKQVAGTARSMGIKVGR